MSLPQSVTIRYATNLLLEGNNDAFEVERIDQIPVIARDDETHVGYYYQATVKTSQDFSSKTAFGATPRAAVRAALEAHKVSFQ